MDVAESRMQLQGPGPALRQPLCRVARIEARGFKCFRDGVDVALSDSGLVCIVGPNGCGKSVLGECLAFALGGGRHMLRARNLASLINQDYYHCRTVPAVGVLNAGCPGDDSGDGHGASRVPRPRSAMQQSLVSKPPPYVAVTFEAPGRGSVRVERRLLAGMAGSDGGGGGSGRGAITMTRVEVPAGSGRWRQTTQEELAATLQPYGICPGPAVDRYVVSQARRGAAVNVSEPRRLLEHIEALLGVGHLQERLTEVEDEIRTTTALLDQQESRAASLRQRREALAPQVARWRRYQAAVEQLAERRVTLRRRQLQRIEQRLSMARRQKDATEEQVADLKLREDALAEAAALSEQREVAAGRVAAAAEKKQATAVAKFSERRALLAKLQAAASLHSDEESTAASAEQRLTARLAELTRELAERRNELARAEELLEELQRQQPENHHHHHHEQQHEDQAPEEHQEHGDDESEKQGHRGSAGGTEGTTAGPSLKRARISAPARAAVAAGRHAAVMDQELHSGEQRQVVLEAEVRQAEQALNEARERANRERDAVVRQLHQRLRDATAELTAVAAPVGVVGERRGDEDLAEAQRALAEAQVRVQLLDEQLEELREADDMDVERHGGRRNDNTRGARGAIHGSTGGSSAPPCVGSSGGGRWSGFDAAIWELMSAPPLAGRLLGRLCDVLRVRRDPRVHMDLRVNPCVDPDLDLEVPVNAALSELCHLPTCLVVTDRGAAEEVIAHFTSRRVGRVTCRILEEVHAPPSGQQPRIRGGEGGGASSAAPRPLLDVVEPVPGAPAAVLELLHSMLGGWGLAPDAQAALAAQEAPGGSRTQPSNPRHQRVLNLVTYCGAVFKTDGEIIAQDAAGGCVSGGGFRGRRGAANPPTNLTRDYWVRAGPMAANQTAGGRRGGGEPSQAATYSALQDVRLSDEEQKRLSKLRMDEMQQLRESLWRQRCEAHTTAEAARGRVAELQAQMQACEEASRQRRSKEVVLRRSIAALQAELRRRDGGGGSAGASGASDGGGISDPDASGQRHLSDAMLQRQEAHLTDLRAALQRSTAKLTQLREAAATAHRLHDEASARAGVTAGASGAAAGGRLPAASCTGASGGVAAAVAEHREQHRLHRQDLQRKLQLVHANREALMGRCRRLEASCRVQQRGLEEAAARRAAATRELREAEQGRLALERQVAEAQSAVEAAISAAQAAHCRKRAVDKEAEDARSLLVAAATARAESEGRLAAARTAVSDLQANVVQHRQLVATATDDLETAKVAAAAAEGHGAEPPGAEKVDAIWRVTAATAPAAGSDGTGEGDRGAEQSGTGASNGLEEETNGKVLKNSQQFRHTDGTRRGQLGGKRAALGRGNAHCGDNESETDNSDGGEEGSSDSDGSRDFVSPSAKGRRGSSRCTAATAAAIAGRRSGHRRGGGGGGGAPTKRREENDGGSGEDGDSDGSREDEWLSAEAEAVAAAERRLEAEKCQIDAAGLQEDVSLLRDLCSCVTAGLDDQLEAAAAKREALQAKRYSHLAAALADVNRQLGSVYCTLTAGAGDAVLSYIPDRTLLFAHGVSLEVRPDEHTWRPFASLSGGQQALASLSLSLALQAVAPSPFYFYDEIDCALDTAAAARVADYLCSAAQSAESFGRLATRDSAEVMGRGGGGNLTALGALLQPLAQSPPPPRLRNGSQYLPLQDHHDDHNYQQEQQQQEQQQQQGRAEGVRAINTAAQYIVVSHKPQVFERARCLVGVYSLRGASAAVVTSGLEPVTPASADQDGL